MSLTTRVLYAELVLLKLRGDQEKKAEERRIRKRRSCWVRGWVQRRKKMGAEVLIRELRAEDERAYINIMRMNPLQFDELLSLVSESITKKDTVMRAAIPASLKLEITLRFLASGDSLTSLSYFFRVPACTISLFLPTVLEAICTALRPYLKVCIFGM